MSPWAIYSYIALESSVEYFYSESLAETVLEIDREYCSGIHIWLDNVVSCIGA